MYSQEIANTHKYRPLHGFFEVKNSDIEGQGLFVKEDRYLLQGPCPVMTHIEVKVGSSSRFFRTPVGGFINHSDNPNCKLVKTLSDSLPYNYYHLEVLRAIKGGEEVTLNYNEVKICAND